MKNSNDCPYSPYDSRQSKQGFSLYDQWHLDKFKNINKMKMFKYEKPYSGSMCKLLLTNGEITRRYYVHNGNGELIWFPNLPENTAVIEWEYVEL